MSSTGQTFEEVAEQVRAMRANGATYVQIKAALGIGTSTVSRMLGVVGTGKPRPRISPEVREKARTLRQDGMTVPDIASALGISRSTAYLMTKDIEWVRNAESATRARDAARRRWDAYESRRETERSLVDSHARDFVGKLTDRELMLVGAALYWAEGSKSKPWNRRESLHFINSDPDVIRLYLAWLQLLGVSAERLTYRVAIHENADVTSAEEFWADVVGADRDGFCRATLKRHNPKTVRKNTGDDYFGCLVICVRKSAREYWLMEALWSRVAHLACTSTGDGPA